MNKEHILQLRNQVKDMFYHAYDNYMKFAFPKDELSPLTCSGIDTWTHNSLTLIDSLDTLVVIGNFSEFSKGVRYIIDHINFDKNVSTSVFETNIRIIGGLLSAHLLAEDKGIMPDYKGELLPLIKDLADRLLPAFDTPTCIPFGSINLKHGVPHNESQVTCTAAGGTYILEFGVLSHILGDDVYKNVALKALRSLFDKRSLIGLMGNHINIFTGTWTLRESGVGSGSDSFYEYLFKAYLLFGDDQYLKMFEECYESLKTYVIKRDWYVEVEMSSGAQLWSIFNSLQAFFPGIQALYGDVTAAKRIVRSFHAVWRRFGMIPEGFNHQQGFIQPGQDGYPLRPELIESVYTLYKITKDPLFLYMGRDILYSLNHHCRVNCGFANVKTVADPKVLGDKMESFFLAETLKYLFLLFDEENFVNSSEKPYIFNTEGHLIPLRHEFLVDKLRKRKFSNETMKVIDAQCEIPSLFFEI